MLLFSQENNSPVACHRDRRQSALIGRFSGAKSSASVAPGTLSRARALNQIRSNRSRCRPEPFARLRVNSAQGLA